MVKGKLHAKQILVNELRGGMMEYLKSQMSRVTRAKVLVGKAFAGSGTMTFVGREQMPLGLIWPVRRALSAPQILLRPQQKATAFSASYTLRHSRPEPHSAVGQPECQTTSGNISNFAHHEATISASFT